MLRTTRSGPRVLWPLEETVGHHRSVKRTVGLANRPASQGADKNIQGIARASLRANTPGGKAIPENQRKVTL